MPRLRLLPFLLLFAALLTPTSLFAERIAAIADVHGDFAAFMKALQLAGAVDESCRWIGGTLKVVQTGDFLDRGEDELRIMDAIERLEREAAAAGGAFYPLLGNHELINVQLIFIYVTPGGFQLFNQAFPEAADDRKLAKKKEKRGRVFAMRPGGPFAMRLSKLKTMLLLDGTLFVHGGISQRAADFGIDRLNQEVSEWMQGKAAKPPEPMRHSDNPLWNRKWSRGTRQRDCAALASMLKQVGAKRMVVGHSVQPDVNSFCDGLVWRIDTGNSKVFGGKPSVLFLEDGVPRAVAPPAKGKD